MCIDSMFVTFKFNGVGISQLFRCHVDLLIGHRWEEGDHVIMPVVSDRGHLIREAGVFTGAFHPFLKYCIGECMKHLFGRKREHVFIQNPELVCTERCDVMSFNVFCMLPERLGRWRRSGTERWSR